ncbi:asparagine synthase-related protein [Desulfurivibrio alkaliphilus]|uniref:asparagine synthase (glutamine-hydrolyzing) n=1 Tax=Desulfurivibrio alkaliphilus (strain DSM 19089 / UNIQEM U267 / AHT2) TaxID=589865 RepID=D6Z619_DESAT|nr:asparagine synthase-related protein [Desulfurivibrio alkaliphilus]ADH84901.1 asparagine synthase [Desulfurivibrio alkaliphilus AHT 2]
MSGIAGVTGEKVGKDQLQEMIGKLTHRGPDNTITRQVADGGLACCELSLSPRATPAMAGKEEPVVLLDGDIYQEIPPGQTNVGFIREVYQREGREGLAKIDGSFACAIVDRGETILARDAVGSRPLIYRARGNRLYFASEAKALLAWSDTVEELPPGHFYSSQEGLQPFPRHTFTTPDFSTPAEAAEILRELLIKATGKMMADGAVQGVSLSGGLDSSIIAAIAKEIDPGIKLFSTTIKRYPSKDLEFAKLMAEFLDLEHHIYQITDQDIDRILDKAVYHLESFDEDCVSGTTANIYTSKLTTVFTNAILVGEGADELFGGYFAELKEVESEEQREEVAEKLVQIAYNTALRRLDRSWLAHSVNYRTPFLDPEVVAFSRKIPLELKVYHDEARGIDIEKWILREAFRGMLPKEIANRTKLRFAGGTGVDDLMDELTAKYVSEDEFKATPRSETGIKLNSPKELYYYKLFRQHFPAGYEKMTARWDPFK